MMSDFWVVKFSDVAIILATLLGPIFAVQVQKYLERRRTIESRRVQIFQTLMATRATRLSTAHVEALNAIPVEFYGSGLSLKSIRETWRIYLDSLEENRLGDQLLNEKRNNAFIDLLHSIASFLNYDFSKSNLKKDVYYPEGHAVIEADQEVIRRGFAQILSGKMAIPMAIKEIPSDPDVVANQVELQKLLREWLQGQRSVKVEQP